MLLVSNTISLHDMSVRALRVYLQSNLVQSRAHDINYSVLIKLRGVGNGPFESR